MKYLHSLCSLGHRESKCYRQGSSIRQYCIFVSMFNQQAQIQRYNANIPCNGAQCIVYKLSHMKNTHLSLKLGLITAPLDRTYNRCLKVLHNCHILHYKLYTFLYLNLLLFPLRNIYRNMSYNLFQKFLDRYSCMFYTKKSTSNIFQTDRQICYER